jgi:hypothetical protein
MATQAPTIEKNGTYGRLRGEIDLDRFFNLIFKG